jgi:hypothetical protein
LRRPNLPVVALSALLILGAPCAADAAEGAASHYLPGVAGDLGLAR